MTFYIQPKVTSQLAMNAGRHLLLALVFFGTGSKWCLMFLYLFRPSFSKRREVWMIYFWPASSRRWFLLPGQLSRAALRPTTKSHNNSSSGSRPVNAIVVRAVPPLPPAQYIQTHKKHPIDTSNSSLFLFLFWRSVTHSRESKRKGSGR